MNMNSGDDAPDLFPTYWLLDASTYGINLTEHSGTPLQS